MSYTMLRCAERLINIPQMPTMNSAIVHMKLYIHIQDYNKRVESGFFCCVLMNYYLAS